MWFTQFPVRSCLFLENADCQRHPDWPTGGVYRDDDPKIFGSRKVWSVGRHLFFREARGIFDKRRGQMRGARVDALV